jgi:acetyl-CoA synthetase
MTIHEDCSGVSEPLGLYASRDVAVAELLCDRHPDDSVAFRVIESNLDVEEIVFGQLRERSVLAAGALAGLGVGE